MRLLPERYAFHLLSKKQIKALNKPATREIGGFVVRPVTDIVSKNTDINDAERRNFIKVLTGATLGIAGLMFADKKAKALVMGGTPSTSVVGLKDSSDTRIDPATQTGLGVTKLSTSLTASGNVRVPASGKKIRAYKIRFSLTADMTSVSFRFTSGGTDFEKYLAPKTGGLYGANNHPNYVEGGVDEALYCNISGTGTVQINIDYLEI